MTAQDHPISFPYGATDGVNYISPKFHRGNDRACPTGTPVVVAGVTIGLTGATGKVTGAHLHTQSGTDINCQKTFNGNGVTEFQAGKVVSRGYGSEWGNFVTVQVGGNYVTYCHLSQINVNIGDELKGGFMNKDQAKQLALYIRLLAGNTVAKANAANEDDANHIVADPNYATGLAKELYNGEWQPFAWRAGHYDEDIKKLKADAANGDSEAAKKLQAIKDALK